MQIEILDDDSYFALCDEVVAQHPMSGEEEDSDEHRERYWEYYYRGFDRIFDTVSKYGKNDRDGYDSEEFSTFVVNDGSLFVVVNVWDPERCKPELILELQRFVATNPEAFTVAFEIEDSERILMTKDRIVANLSDPPEPDALTIIERFNEAQSQ